MPGARIYNPMAKPIREIQMLSSMAGNGFALQVGDRCKVGKNRLINTETAKNLIADKLAIRVEPENNKPVNRGREQATLILGETR